MRCNVNDIGQQPKVRLLVHLDHADDVDITGSVPGLVVDRERVNRATPGNHVWSDVATATIGAVRRRRVDEIRACQTPQEPQATIRA
jgi:hypothetical protein